MAKAVSQALVRRLNGMLDRADAVWKKEDMDARIAKLSSYYHAGYGGEYPDDATVVHVNKVYPRVRTAMSSLSAKRPEIVTRGMRSSDDHAAEVSQVMLNYLVRHMHYSPELRDWLFWARLCMYGVLKIGMERDRAGVMLPMIRSYDPRSVRVDPTTDRFRPEEGRWQAFRFKRSVSALRDSGLYEDSAVDRLAEQVASGIGSSFQEETTEVWLWEHFIWEKIEGKSNLLVATAATGVEDSAFSIDKRAWIREDVFTDVIGLPGRFLFFIPSPKTWYPVSPIELWMDQQKEINAFRTQKLLHVERSNKKTFYDPTAFGDQAEALESGHVKQYIPVPNANGDISKVVYPEPESRISADIYQGEQEADLTIMEVDGIGSVQLGRTEAERGSTSATRDALVDQSLRLRMSDNQEIWEDALEEVFQSVLNLAQDQMEGDLRMKITGLQEITMNRAEIKGDIEVIISSGSTQPRDREREFEKAKELYGMLSANPMVNQVRLLRYVLQKQGDIKDVDGWLAPVPPPMAAPPAPGTQVPGAPQEPPGAEDLMQMALRGVEEGTSPLSLAADARAGSGGF